MKWLRRKLRWWLGITSLHERVELDRARADKAIENLMIRCGFLDSRIDKMSESVTNSIADLGVQIDQIAKFQIERYTPPPTPEPTKPKVRQARTFKEFSDIMEREFEERETQDAAG